MTRQKVEKKGFSEYFRQNSQPLIYVIISLLLFPLFAYQVFFIVKDMVNGDGAIKNMIVQPRYQILRIPDTLTASRYDAAGRMAADFANIYFPAQNMSSLKDEYAIDTTTDPWQRPSRYPPFADFICAVSFCRLPYGYASVIHILIQLCFFFVGFGVAFKELQISQYFVPSLFLVLVCIFLTPAGLSWIERGQFSLYVALSYLWLFLGIIKEKKHYIVFSALFAFVKWTSVPFLALFFCVYLLTSENIKALRSKMVFCVTFILTVEVLFLLFAKNSLLFLAGLISQEVYAPSYGISLTQILPGPAVKVIPLLFVLVGYLSIRRGANSVVKLIPYFAGSAIILLTFPTIAFEYNILSIFGLIPFVIYWLTLPRNSRLSRQIMLSSFFLFIILGSFSVIVFRSDINTIIFYICISLICISLSFVWKHDTVNNTAGPIS